MLLLWLTCYPWVGLVVCGKGGNILVVVGTWLVSKEVQVVCKEACHAEAYHVAASLAVVLLVDGTHKEGAP